MFEGAEFFLLFSEQNIFSVRLIMDEGKFPLGNMVFTQYYPGNTGMWRTTNRMHLTPSARSVGE